MHTFRFIVISCLALAGPLASRAGNKGTGVPPTIHVFTDTIPEVKKPAEKADEESPLSPNPNLIKEIPKARRQVKPVALPKMVPVKPVKIIKPKIVVRTGLLP